MPDVLFITPEFPFPARQGASLRNAHNIRGIAQNHRVTVLGYSASRSVDTDRSDGEIPNGVGAVTVPAPPAWNVARRLRHLLTTKLPDMASRRRDALFETVLAETLEKGGRDGRGYYDIVQVEGIEMAWTIPQIRKHSPMSRVIFDDHNAEAALQQTAMRSDLRRPGRWHAAVYSWIQSGRLLRYERWACALADRVLAVSDEDAEKLALLGADRRTTVVPNSIDAHSYDLPSLEPVSSDVLFVGKMDYRPNVDAVDYFARDVWPLIRESLPSARFVIAGMSPTQTVTRLSNLDGVVVTGFVDDVRDYLAGTRCVVMPFRMGSGTRLKFAEAMAAGVPVVSTTLGAAGYPVESGRELLIADHSQGLAQSILSVLSDKGLANRLAGNGRALAQRYDWRAVAPTLNQVYEELLLDRRAVNPAA